MNLDPADRQTDRLPILKTGLRRYQVEGESPPIRLRRLARSTGTASVSNDIDLSEIILELPLSDLAQFLPKHLAVRLYKFIQSLFEVEEIAPFPCRLDEIVRNDSLLSALRSQLAHINNLTELIINPPVILIDERQELFFYRSLPISLRPISFTLLFLLAKTPAEFVRREDIYNHLWPGKMNYEGTNKPYERQISDHKCKLTVEIKKGVRADFITEGETADFRTLNVREDLSVSLNICDQGGSGLFDVACSCSYDGSEVIHSQPAAAHIEQDGWMAVGNFGSSFGPLSAPRHRCLTVELDTQREGTGNYPMEFWVHGLIVGQGIG